MREKSAAFIESMKMMGGNNSSNLYNPNSPIQKLRAQLFKKKKDGNEKITPTNRTSLIKVKPTPIKKEVVAQKTALGQV